VLRRHSGTLGGTGARAARLLAVLITSITVVLVAVRAQTAGENPPAQQTTPAPATPPAAPTPAPAASGNELPTVEVIQKQAEPAPKAVGPNAAKTKVVTAPPVPAPPPPTAPLAPTGLSTLVKMSPVGGSEIPLAKVPGAVSTITSGDIARNDTTIIENVLQAHVPGVIITDLQGNEFQADVQYRGFESSPLNGVPQGLAIYQNGVRINEAFGDIINWDFLPAIAINDIAVVSGNPVFGLNALGGAIVIGMKDGFNYQGADIDVRGGSFGGAQVAAEAAKGVEGSGPTSPPRPSTTADGVSSLPPKSAGPTPTSAPRETAWSCT